LAQAAARTLFDSRHPPTLVEACRCFSVAVRPGGGLRAWRAVALGDDTFAGRVVFIASITARADVLEGALNCLTALAMVGELVPYTTAPSEGEGVPSHTATSQRAAAAAAGGEDMAGAAASVTSSGCGAICRAGGISLITAATNPDATEATPKVMDAALRLLDALMVVGEGVEDVYNSPSASASAASAAANVADAAEARRLACSSGVLREHLVRLLAGGGVGSLGEDRWAGEAGGVEELRVAATLALAQLAGEAGGGSGAVGVALAMLPAALERLIGASCAQGSNREDDGNGREGGEENDDEEARAETRQAALYLLGAVCAVLAGPPLPAHKRTEALARLTAAVLRGAEQGGIGTWEEAGGGESAHDTAAVGAVVSAVCRAAVVWEQTLEGGGGIITSASGSAVRAFTTHLELFPTPSTPH